jgi:hypothetical protein
MYAARNMLVAGRGEVYVKFYRRKTNIRCAVNIGISVNIKGIGTQRA